MISDRGIRAATLTLFLMGVTFAATLPYMSLIALNQLGMSPGAYSLLVAVSAVSNIVAVVSLGVLSDTLPDRRPIILVVSLVGAAGFGLFFLFPSVPLLYISLLTFQPVSNSLFSLLFATVRARSSKLEPGAIAAVNANVRAVFSGAFILVPGLVGLFLATRENMSDGFGIASVAFLLCFLTYLLFAPRADAAAAAVKRESFFTAVRSAASATVIVRIAAIAVVVSSHWANAIVFPLIIVGMPDGTTVDVGLIAGGVAALEIPAMLAWGSLLKRRPAGLVIIFGALIFALYLVGLSFASEKWHLYLLMLPNAIGGAALLSVPLSYLQEMMDGRPGLGSSLLSLVTFGARGVSASVFALGTAAFSLGGTALIAAIVSTAGCVFLFLLDRPGSKAGQSQTV